MIFSNFLKFICTKIKSKRMYSRFLYIFFVDGDIFDAHVVKCHFDTLGQQRHVTFRVSVYVSGVSLVFVVELVDGSQHNVPVQVRVGSTLR